MQKLILIGALCSTTACLGSSSSGLADFNTAHGGIAARVVSTPTDATPSLDVELGDASGDCPQLDEDVTVTFNGQPMQISSLGGRVPEAFHDDICDTPEFVWNGEAGALPSASTDTIVFRDHTGTWTIETPDLFANGFVLNPDHPNEVAWQGASRIWEDGTWLSVCGGAYGACDSVDTTSGLTISGNVLTAPSDEINRTHRVTGVGASADFDAIRCDGPASCSVAVYSASGKF